MGDGAPLLVVDDEARPWLARRTVRALGTPGAERARVVRAGELPALLAQERSACLLRAGVFGLAPGPAWPSATGRPLLALGAQRGEAQWAALLEASGGLLDDRRLPEAVNAVQTDDAPALGACVAAALARGGAERLLQRALAALLSSGRHRVCRLSSLDHHWSERPRLLEVVPALHRGGAEQVALTLLRELPGQGVEALLAVLDAPRRAAHPAPAGAVLLYQRPGTREERLRAAADLTRRAGIDLVHAHLFDRTDLLALGSAGVPVATTLHNAAAALPAGLHEATELALLLACSRGVLGELPSRAPRARVAWNGVPPHLADPGARARLRAALGVRERQPLLLFLANLRAQKRPALAVQVLGALVARGRDCSLALVGEPLPASADARAAEEELERTTAALGLSGRVLRLGSRSDVPELLAAADLLLCTSAHEGLSLAQLEACAAGLPVVACETHGTDELRRLQGAGAVTPVPRDAGPCALADAVEAALRAPRPEGALARGFTSAGMAARHAHLVRRLLAPGPQPEGPLVVLTNNLSTGGAQSSARRLVAGLRARGLAAACAVVEEQPDHPTPGRQALLATGAEVFATDPLRFHPLAEVAGQLLEWLDRRRPRAVLFWNLVAPLRVLLADALPGTRVFDVSPGEMSYASLERYFARPLPEVPVLGEREYGRLLAGVVAKYSGERERAERLGAPVEVIPNGLPVPELPLPPLPPGERVVVGTLSRLAPGKQLEQLIDAVAAMPEAARARIELRVAGGPESGSVEYADALARRAAGLPVRFVGPQESTAFLAQLHFFAMVSAPAGCPNASLEAMACGRAVVATDWGGARDQLVHGETGLLVPAGDADRFAEALIQLAGDLALAERMGCAGHLRARTHFSLSRMVDRYAALCLGDAVSLR